MFFETFGFFCVSLIRKEQIQRNITKKIREVTLHFNCLGSLISTEQPFFKSPLEVKLEAELCFIPLKMGCNSVRLTAEQQQL